LVPATSNAPTSDARQHDIPCTEPQVSRWSDGNIRFFYAEVEGIVFEVMRIEPTDT
jgi:hypothetical protein